MIQRWSLPPLSGKDEMLGFCSKLTRKAVTEGIITFSHCESFQACLSLV